MDGFVLAAGILPHLCRFYTRRGGTSAVPGPLFFADASHFFKARDDEGDRKLKGTTTGSVTKVIAKMGKKTVAAKGMATWTLTAKKLKVGVNKVTLTATGPGGTSTPVQVTIGRK